MSIATLTQTRAATDEIRRKRKALQRAQTEMSLYSNIPGDVGLAYRGHLSVNDVVRHEWPMKKNVSSAGYFTVRASHHLAKMIMRIPNNPDECKNIVARVDRYGGAWRWTGLMHHWEVETKDGVDYLTAHFNDDMQFAQFLLGVPNPLLPVPIFQGPRDWFQFGPGDWCASSFMWLNMVRNQIEEAFASFILPDDPFDIPQWSGGAIDSLQPQKWQVHIRSKPYALSTALWTFIGSRTNTADSVIADTLGDGQLVLRYRRYFTGEGEPVTGLIHGVNNIPNGALVFWIDDESGFGEKGTFFSGGVVGGLLRSIVTFTTDGVEDILSIVDDNETLYADEYWQSGFMGSFASAPTVGIEDSWFNDLQSRVTHSPATATKIIVGGDNPTADAIAKLIIESIGNLLGYFLLFGFDSLGDIISDVVMPFLVGTIAAWDEAPLANRKSRLGWVHLWEIYFQGAGSRNSWSLAALADIRAGVKQTDDETSHTIVVDESTWLIPGLHVNIGQRFWSTAGALQRNAGIDLHFVNQIEEMSESGDDTGASRFVLKCGQNKAAKSPGERRSEMFSRAMATIQDVGVHLIS